MKKKHYLWILLFMASISLAFYAGRMLTPAERDRPEYPITAKGETPLVKKPHSEARLDGNLSGTGGAKTYRLSPPLTVKVSKEAILGKPEAAEDLLMNPPPFPQPDAAALSLLAREMDALREELAETLRKNNNLSEEDVEQHLQGIFPPLVTPPVEDQIDAADLTPEQQMAEMEMSLLEAGAPQEQIDAIIQGFMTAIHPPEEFQAPPLPPSGTN
jgi:hypothetical protein